MQIQVLKHHSLLLTEVEIWKLHQKYGHIVGWFYDLKLVEKTYRLALVSYCVCIISMDHKFVMAFKFCF